MTTGIGGLYNLGNSCYINTAIQCLASCDVFLEVIWDHDPMSTTPIMNALHDTLREIRINGRTIAPKDLMRALHHSMGSMIDIRDQNDICEFISLLLDKLNREICVDKRIRMKDIIENTMTFSNTAYGRQKKKMDIDWMNKVGKEYSLIVPLFYGQSISQVVCADCGKIWHNYEVFQDLSVAITASTLEGCIANNFEDVRLTDWKCDKCGKGGRASVKTNMLWKVPRVLMVTLKRFDAQGRKDGRRIAVPEVLQLDDYVLGSKAKKRYMLQSVGIHSGSFFGGHYRALCRANSSTWLVIDDESVHTIREWTHAASDGYCFFYLGIDQ